MVLRGFGIALHHLMSKRTGTTTDNALSGAVLGGLGIGWARASMASVSSSSSDDPELCTIRLLSKRPSRSMVKATVAVPCSPRERAVVG